MSGVTTPTRRRLGALLPPAVYLLISVFLYHRLWANPAERYLVDSMRDQNQWEWFFDVVAHNAADLANPLFTTLQNHPDGVNLMANTGMPGLSVPLAPLTLLLGPAATWAVALTLGSAATAWAWYRLFTRHFGFGRPAAALAGGFCAFAPPMVSHGTAHPNLVVLVLIPFIIGRVVMIFEAAAELSAEPAAQPTPQPTPEPATEPTARRRLLRDGVILGLLAAYQILLGAEALLLTASGLALFVLGYALCRPAVVRERIRGVATGLGLGIAVSLPLVAFPLIWQFFGPQSYRSLEHGEMGNDVAALTAFSRRSLAGSVDSVAGLAANPTEENAFFGWPLLVLAIGITVWLWRMALVRALAVTASVAVLLSLGQQITVNGHRTGIPGPWWVMDRLPLFGSVLESRYTMLLVPVIGILLALATEQITEASRSAAAASAAAESDTDTETDPAAPRPRLPLRLLWAVLLTQALLPILPTPYPVVDRRPVPAFIADGTWREYVTPGRTLVPVPLPDPGNAEALHWQVVANLGFSLPEGYFVGPHGADGKGGYGAERRPTSLLLSQVASTGRIPELTAVNRTIAKADLKFWQADAVVLDPAQPQLKALRTTLNALLGPGRRAGGVDVWKVPR